MSNEEISDIIEQTKDTSKDKTDAERLRKVNPWEMTDMTDMSTPTLKKISESQAPPLLGGPSTENPFIRKPAQAEAPMADDDIQPAIGEQRDVIEKLDPFYKASREDEDELPSIIRVDKPNENSHTNAAQYNFPPSNVLIRPRPPPETKKANNNNWDDTIQQVVFNVAKKTKALFEIHKIAAQFFSRRNNKITILTVTVSLIATVLTIFPQNSANPWNPFGLLVKGFAPLVTFLIGLNRYLNYSGRSEQHRSAAAKYEQFYHTISTQLMLKNLSLRTDGAIFFKLVFSEFSTVNAASPELPDEAKKAYQTRRIEMIERKKRLELERQAAGIVSAEAGQHPTGTAPNRVQQIPSGELTEAIEADEALQDITIGVLPGEVPIITREEDIRQVTLKITVDPYTDLQMRDFFSTTEDI